MRHEVIAAAPPTSTASQPVSRRTMALILIGAWLFACAIMIAISWQDILTLSYPDPDDQLRLLEVHDWLAGQSWWDVSQHRMNPPFGGQMHWSRLVDLPIAFVIVILRPFLGYATAQTIAAVIVPLVTLGFSMMIAALLTRRLLGRDGAYIAALLVACSPGALQQMRPLRVDHHGWQIGLAAAVLLALLDRKPLRSGLVAGAVASVWLRISLEGLPLAAAAGGLVGLRWALAKDDGENGRMISFFGALAIGSALLIGAFIPRDQWHIAWCDSISAPHIAMFETAFLGSLAIALVPARPLLRIPAGAMLAAASLYVYHLSAPACGIDAFANLDPLVRRVWFNNVLEGMPLWKQSASIAALAIGYPLVALFGTWRAWRAAKDDGSGEQTIAWACYGLMLVAAIGAAILVQRAGGAANMIALPGGLYLLLGWLRRARAQTDTVKRLLGTVAAVLIFAPVTPALAVTLLAPENRAKAKAEGSSARCASTANYRSLGAIRPGLMLSLLDLGPGVILNSPNSVIAGSYHRNSKAIGQVIGAYMSPPDLTHAYIRRRAIDYVVLCPHAPEIAVYRHYAPNGFAAQLVDGRIPAWLQPVPLANGAGMRLWRVVS